MAGSTQDSGGPGASKRRSGRQQEKQRIGLRLREVRKARGLTQDQVAALLSLNRTAYTHYENGTNLPDIFTLLQLAGIYEYPPEEFIRYLTSWDQAQK